VSSLRHVRRYLRHWWQRRYRGWDDSELWDLDETIAQFIAPRLRRFSELCASHPSDLSFEEWKERLALMQKAFEWYADGRQYECLPDPTWLEEGLALFSKYYDQLWD
jgi:hypothetical protein